MKKEVKHFQVGIKLNERQIAALDELIAEGKGKTRPAVIQYLINQLIILK